MQHITRTFCKIISQNIVALTILLPRYPCPVQRLIYKNRYLFIHDSIFRLSPRVYRYLCEVVVCYLCYRMYGMIFVLFLLLTHNSFGGGGAVERRGKEGEGENKKGKKFEKPGYRRVWCARIYVSGQEGCTVVEDIMWNTMLNMRRKPETA